MDKLRLRFEKTGKAVYISHLDLMRVMQRAFQRADVALRHSEGFNPHALLSIALPLPVGCASVCELLDFRVAEETDLAALPARLTAVLPAGIRVTEVWEPERKIAQLKWLRVSGRFDYDARDPAAMARGLAEVFDGRALPVLRKTKRGEQAFDLAPHLREIAAVPAGDAVRFEVVLSAQEPTVNPALLPEALAARAPALAPDFAFFTRVETYDAAMTVFR